MGRPDEKPIVWFKGVLYQVASWKMARKVAAKVEFHAEELFLGVRFIVTNAETPNRASEKGRKRREKGRLLRLPQKEMSETAFNAAVSSGNGQ